MPRTSPPSLLSARAEVNLRFDTNVGPVVPALRASGGEPTRRH
ncbi:hypothetical protein SBD_2251 [Streptomyces bottropensis ATCC 25435]|uniref:Uncharacterized protein n=1 Tax=Streptomyces bottropensis ATCC 25435 TaxID=1054862 RepID=M3EJ24_9ACTN|nr:hypothetical protein SBD_2251 [Streptomyces bottropensis ATCC 25435]